MTFKFHSFITRAVSTVAIIKGFKYNAVLVPSRKNDYIFFVLQFLLNCIAISFMLRKIAQRRYQGFVHLVGVLTIDVCLQRHHFLRRNLLHE